MVGDRTPSKHEERHMMAAGNAALPLMIEGKLTTL
jgi:hypothetical protein